MHTPIQKAKLRLLNKYKNKWLDINRKIKSGRYKVMDLGNRMIGDAMAMIPKAGCVGFSTALSIAVVGVLENLGITVDDVTFLPGKDKINELLTKHAIDSIIEVQESICQNPYV